MPCGHTRLHSPQSVHLPATWKARMIWNIFSSKESTICLLCSCQTYVLSNTHLRQLQAGQTFLQALQRMHLLKFTLEIMQNAPAEIIASIRSTSAKRS